MSNVKQTKLIATSIEKGTSMAPFSILQKTPVTADVTMDQNLIIRAQNGDKAAFQQLVAEMLPQVLRICFRMINDQAEAEDLAQDVMIKLWKNLSKYDATKAKLSTWAYRIASNHCLDALRRKRPEQLDEDYDEAIEPGQLESLYEKEITKSIEHALALLPERQRLALVLFHYEGTSLAETGDIMDCSVDAVESLLRRARRKLKSLLEPTWQQMKREGA